MKTITICREYGAGGHSIGQKVAGALGIELYDKDIIRATAKEMDLDYAQILNSEEEISRSESFLRYLTPISFEYKDYYFEAQKGIILELAKKGPCVIVGRCAEIILREAGIDSLNVFLYADESHRLPWVKQHLDTDNDAEAVKFMHRQERARRAYYEAYTDSHFGDRHNYDIMLDSGAIGYDACAEIIISLAKD
ncbi:MAG: cytidylate kinase-like family protein [Lachnospiraceae bacterium]|nr:cytidylate kinase-like family protein [Lachnospiraceae bacterium]